MSETNPLLKSIRESAGLRLAVLFGSFFILLLCSTIIGEGINYFPFGSERTHILLSSAVQCILAFCIPAFLLARYSSNDWKGWLELKKSPSIISLAGVVLVYVISMPAMEWLIEWNSNLHLPESMSALEETIRGWEESSEKITATLLDTHGIWSVLAGILVIGVLTGFSEELFFRGGLQGIFQRSSLNKATAVWLAAFIFSFMHFQFFGFLPRLLMGVFFGYLLLWTRSIWVPMFAHVWNNSMVVVQSAIGEGESTSLVDNTGSGIFLGNPVIVIGSVVMTALFLIYCKDFTFKNPQSLKRWQRSQLPPATEK